MALAAAVAIEVLAVAVAMMTIHAAMDAITDRHKHKPWCRTCTGEPSAGYAMK